jgi:uncharacterized DUF497 family protein
VINVFRWNDWNREKLEKHGVSIAEAERVVNDARRPYPQHEGNGKWRVIGRGQGHRPIQIFYVVDTDKTIFIIHAMPLTTRRRRG